MSSSIIPRRPYQPSAPDRYCRLFEPSPAAPKINWERLSDSMKSDQTAIPQTLWRSDPVGAGYTYFGQFVDHDLTEDRTPFHAAGITEPKDTENRRVPYLDLDSLYGHGPACPLYRDLYDADGISFRLGESIINGQQFDVPLTNGSPRFADPRNGENIIVRQVHAMFLKLHNVAVENLKKNNPTLSEVDIFAKARERVTWQYQWLVRHDFLSRICNRDTYHDVVERRHYRIDWQTAGFSIPIEFSQAAFRFGHSMVRPGYRLNKNTDAHLHELFMTTGQLSPMVAVDWYEFLEGNEFSMRIDTSITTDLFELPDADIRLFVTAEGPHGPSALPLRTLRRGAASRVPTGQDVRDKLCPTATLAPVPEAPGYSYDPWEILKELQLQESIPLWYYILLEAELNENGLRLGEVGSRLVLEVIEGCLWADSNSFVVRCGPEWGPPVWTAADGTNFQIETLFGIAKLVGLVQD